MGLGLGKPDEVSDDGDSNLVGNWLNGRWKINNQKFKAEVQKTQNLLEKRDIRPMSDHMDFVPAHLHRLE